MNTNEGGGGHGLGVPVPTVTLTDDDGRSRTSTLHDQDQLQVELEDQEQDVPSPDLRLSTSNSNLNSNDPDPDPTTRIPSPAPSGSASLPKSLSKTSLSKPPASSPPSSPAQPQSPAHPRSPPNPKALEAGIVDDDEEDDDEADPDAAVNGDNGDGDNDDDEKHRSENPKVKSVHGPGSDDGVMIVDWDGPDDPENPRNWPINTKWRAAIIVSAFTFISPVSSSMIAPASLQLAQHFHISSSVLLQMTTSIFVLAYAIGPLFLGPLSEIYGRSRVLQGANVWYLVWNLACAFATNANMLIGFRFLAGLGGSAPLSIGGGVLGDLFAPSQRGRAIAVYSLAPLLGPVIGPLCGAWIAERSTWKWVFWSTTIVDAAVQCAGVVWLRETFEPILLERKATRIKIGMGIPPSDTSHIRTKYQVPSRHWKALFAHSMIRPFALFIREPIIQLLGLYMAFVYGLIYLLLTTMTGIFVEIYGEEVGVAGLNYLALGVGLTGASQVNARMLDRIYRRLSERNGGVGKPEFRLPPVIPGSIVLPIGLLLTGWGAQEHVHWIVPDIGITLVGIGMILIFQCIQTYVIDAFTLHAASALAAVSFMRSLAGFGFPLFAPAMYGALGYGKGDTVLAVCAVVLGCPAPWLLLRYGEGIRRRSRYAE